MNYLAIATAILLASINSEAQSQNTPSCPADVGYLRNQMVFTELKNNPGFADPIDNMIRKAGGVEQAISAVEEQILDTENSQEQAAQTAKQSYGGSGNALASRCENPQGVYCSANYTYHLLKEANFYYQEILNAMRCRQSGQMVHATYKPSPLK